MRKPLSNVIRNRRFSAYLLTWIFLAATIGAARGAPPPAWPGTWMLYGPVERDLPPPGPGALRAAADEFRIGDRVLEGRPISFSDDQHINFSELFGGHEVGQTVYLFTTVRLDAPQSVNIGCSADWWMQWWVDGEPVYDTIANGNIAHPFRVGDHFFRVDLPAGETVLAVRVISGSGSFELHAGFMDDLAANFLVNSHFAHGRTLAEALTWHRMTGTDYVANLGGEPGAFLRPGGYDPASGFALTARVTPGETPDGIHFLLDQYACSRQGAWYLALDANRRLRLVMIDETPYPGGYRSINPATRLEPSRGYDVALVFDGTEAALYLDGEPFGAVSLRKPLMVPEAPVRVGGRADQPFPGEIRDLRFYTGEAAAALGARLAGGDDGGAIEPAVEVLAWDRETGPVFARDVDDGDDVWTLDGNEAFRGERSARGDARAALVLTQEIWAPLPEPWTFSVYMKSDRADGVDVELAVGAYWRLREQKRATEVRVGPEWERHELVVSGIPDRHRRGGRNQQGPVNFYVRPLGPGSVWVDALQWEPGAIAGPYRPGLDPEGVSPGDLPLLPLVEQAAFPPSADLPVADGQIPLHVWHEGEQPAPSVSQYLGVPFPRGAWSGEGGIALEREGSPVDVQAEVLTRWPADGSVQALGVGFTSGLEPGLHVFDLRYDAASGGQEAESLLRREGERDWRITAGDLEFRIDPRAGTLWESVRDARTGEVVFQAASVRAAGLKGAVFDSARCEDVRYVIEREGPLHVSLLLRGRLCSEQGKALAAFDARVYFWRDLPSFQIDLTLVNTQQEGSTVLREAYWQTSFAGAGDVERVWIPDVEAPVPPGDHGVLQFDHAAVRRFEKAHVSDGRIRSRLTNPRGPLWLGVDTARAGYHLQVLHGWERHPSMVAVKTDGQVRGYAWPSAPVAGLHFARGMSFTRSFTLRQTEAGLPAESRMALAEALAQPPVALADPAWFAGTDLLMPFHARDPVRFPFMEEVLGAEALLGRLSPAGIESGRMYGLFDFGDSHGDGGWGNLESFMDYAALFFGLRNGDPAALRQGLVSAQHYRDIDIHQYYGGTIIHNPNHIMGSYHIGHAWPEGVITHYLVTGDARSRDVAARHGEFLLNLPPDDGQLRGTRSLGRFFLNLAHIYQITGDARIPERLEEQLAYNTHRLETLLAGHPDRTIFGGATSSDDRYRLAPYHAWYGCAALIKMYQLTGDERLLPHIEREINATLNRELYDLDLEQLWPGLPPAEGMPIMLADFARHRGSFVYPVLMAWSRITGDPAPAQFALRTLYAWAMEGRATRSVQAILASAPLAVADRTEAELLAETRDLLWNAAAPTLLNGDFTASLENWEHWRPHTGKSLAYHVSWQDIRRQCTTLDTDVYKVNAPSLRFDLRPEGFFSRISLDSARFRIEPGRYRLSGWFRHTEHASTPRFRLVTRPLDGRYKGLSLSFRPDQTEPSVGNDTELEIGSAEVTLPDGDGWRRFQIEFTAPGRRVAHVEMNSDLASGAPSARIWLDGLSLEPLPAGLSGVDRAR